MSIAEIEALSITDIRADWVKKYLLDRRWKQKHFKNEGLLVFEAPMKADNGETIIQILPRSEQSPDFVMRARELVRALSVIEDRPVWDVIRDIKNEFAPGTKTPSIALTSATIGLFVLLLASLAGNAALWERAEANRRRTDELVGEIRHEMARSNQTIAKTCTVLLDDSIKHGDEWLKLKAIDSLIELAETNPIHDVAEPVLVWAAGDDQGLTPKVRDAAAKALKRIRSQD